MVPRPRRCLGPQARGNLRVWGSPRSAMPELRYGKNDRARAGSRVWFFFRVRNTTTGRNATPQREAGSRQIIAIEKGGRSPRRRTC